MSMQDMPMSVESELPRFTLRQLDMPDVRNWEVGDQKYIIMRVEMVGKRNRKDLPAREDRGKVEGDFQMLNIKVLGDEPVDAKSLESKHFEMVVAKAKGLKANA